MRRGEGSKRKGTVCLFVLGQRSGFTNPAHSHPSRSSDWVQRALAIYARSALTGMLIKPGLAGDHFPGLCNLVSVCVSLTSYGMECSISVRLCAVIQALGAGAWPIGTRVEVHTDREQGRYIYVHSFTRYSRQRHYYENRGDCVKPMRYDKRHSRLLAST